MGDNFSCSMMPRFVRLPPFCVIPLLLACRGETTQRAVLGDAPPLGLVEELQIARVDDPARGFSAIAAIDIADDGTIFVLDWKECHVRVFSRAGELVTTFGRKGQGPGEFSRPDRLGLLGDSVWVSDPGNRRITFFTTRGRLIRSVPAPSVSVGDARLVASVRAARPRRDRTIASVPSTGTYTVGVPADSALLPRLLFDENGRVVDTLGWHMRYELGAKDLRLGDAWVAIRPLQFPSYPIELEEDTLRLVVEQTPVSATEGWVYVRRTDERGNEKWMRRYGYGPRRVDHDLVETTVEYFATTFFGQNGAPRPGASDLVRDALVFPAFLPAVSRVVAGKDGTLWLQRGDMPRGEPPRWIVLDAKGTIRGELTLPADAQPGAMRVLGARVWLPISDSSGFMWLGQYRIALGR
jgi:hypothetical protein